MLVTNENETDESECCELAETTSRYSDRLCNWLFYVVVVCRCLLLFVVVDDDDVYVWSRAGQLTASHVTTFRRGCE